MITAPNNLIRKSTITAAAVLTVAVSFLAYVPQVNITRAVNNLASSSDTLSRLKISVTGVTHTLRFTLPTGTDLTAGDIINISTTDFEFTEQAVTVTDDGGSAGGTPALSGNGANQIVTLTGISTISAGSVVEITGLIADNPGTPGNKVILVQVDENADTDYDDANDATTQVAVAILSDDQIVVSATVDPSLSVSYNANTLSLGTLTEANVNRRAIQQTTSTNGAGGYAATVRAAAAADVNLDHTATTDTIPAVADGTVTAGDDEYGIQTSQASQTVAQDSGGLCVHTSLRTGDGNQASTGLTTSAQQWASSTGPVAAQTRLLCFNASITGITPAGTYQSTVTLVTTATF